MDEQGGPISADGHCFLRAHQDGVTRHLVNRLGISVGPDACEADIGPAGPQGKSERVKSTSREARRFVLRVLGTMARTSAPRPVRPVPKPTAAAPKSPIRPEQPTPCPACNGEGWFACDLCDGEGTVTARAAQAWRDAHR